MGRWRGRGGGGGGGEEGGRRREPRPDLSGGATETWGPDSWPETVPDTSDIVLKIISLMFILFFNVFDVIFKKKKENTR